MMEQLLASELSKAVLVPGNGLTAVLPWNKLSKEVTVPGDELMAVFPGEELSTAVVAPEDELVVVVSKSLDGISKPELVYAFVE